LFLAGLCAGGYLLVRAELIPGLRPDPLFDVDSMARPVGIGLLYVYCYAMTAVALRVWVMRSVPATKTWVLLLVLCGLGCAVPPIISFLINYDTPWLYEQQWPWLLFNPFVAMVEFSTRTSLFWEVFLTFAAGWATTVTVLTLPWFIRQFRAFQPYDGPTTPPPVILMESSSQTLSAVR
ncbi:MAG: hypothetical protein NZO58_08140, partial [Gemmataceae bacterium]|nr:hypothetical protein [Gemmataceae bacterium]